MTTPQIQSDPIYSLPFTYLSGLNTSWLSNTSLNVAAGQCRDSNDIIDMPLGANNPPLNGAAVSAPLLLDATTSGANGLDTGSLAASTWYSVYLIGDSRYIQPIASLLSLTTNTYPLLPYGYDSYRLIGYALTDGSSHFLKFYQYGNGNYKKFWFTNPIQVLNAGSQTSFTLVDLSDGVPPIATDVKFLSLHTPAVAADLAAFRPYIGSGSDTMFYVNGVVAGVQQDLQIEIPCNLTTIASVVSPAIEYKVTASGALNLYVIGFDIFL